MHDKRRWWTVSLTGLILLVTTLGDAAESETAKPGAAGAAFDDASLEFFEKQVRPILAARCNECHGAGKGDPKGGLLLTSRAGALKGGDTGPAVVPGKPKESLLVSAIQYGDVYQMPPKSKLPAHEISTLIKWVELGAPWSKESVNPAGTVKPFDLGGRKSEHWCWQPVTDKPDPTVKNRDWPVSSVDRFILGGLESKGLTPAAPAQKQILLRRVYFDLIGLPPTAADVDQFLNDHSPLAFERVVDRLLNSVHFGERWGRHWLDLVRYAETRGHEFEPIIPNAWQYRDYVIRALNADVPYDQFLTENIAGDLMTPRTSDLVTRSGLRVRSNESVLGTGFWFLGEEVHSPVDIRKDETDRMDNRLDVMSKTFLGLTVACARCHDHKFDAISQRDYYALTGFLISGSYRQVRFQTQINDRTIAESLEGLRNEAKNEIARVLFDTARPSVEKASEYLQSARRLLESGLTQVTFPTVGARKEIVFADFESPTYGEWKIEGTAFGNRPPRKSDNVYDAPLEGFLGERLVNSHRNSLTEPNHAGTRDAQTGRMLSPEFVIEHKIIRFLIGGGAHADKTCLNLLVSGKKVRTATGSNSGSLRSEHWDVAEFLGKKARLEIVDAETGGWGHILVDQIVFADEMGSSRLQPDLSLSPSDEAHRKILDLASQKGLDAVQLALWCQELIAARSDKRHVLHRFVTPSAALPPQTISVPDYPGLVVDFGSPQPGQLIQDGVSFGLRPTVPGRLEIYETTGSLDVRATMLGAWERDLFWKGQRLAPGTEDDHGTLGGWHRHGRMVRTPEFTQQKSRVWYLVRGSIRAYADVNSHLVVAGPLHGGVLREFKHDDGQWHWVAHDMQLYRGNRMHIEFSPVDDGDCAVAMVVQSDDMPAMPAPAIDPGSDSPERQAVRIQGLIQSAFRKLMASVAGSPPEGPVSLSESALTNWIVDRRSLFGIGLDQAIQKRLQKLQNAMAELNRQVEWESQSAPAMLDGNGVDEVLLVRGNSSAPRDPIHRRFLEAMGGAEPPKEETGSGRLQLAQQMIQSPLAARVAVNRVWYHLFGRGIFPSVDNMGVLGQPPTHPELLDHLAIRFQKDGWSTKRLIRSLLLSRTYQMSSQPSEPAEGLDPDNLLWHRMPIKRLEGEVIRDALLAVSGRLDPKAFGPSVPIHLTPFMEGRGRPGVVGPVDGDGRRSIYIAVRRNFLSPMMLAFDTPSPFSTVGRRTTSNVPAQALILMNDPLVIQLSRRWADQVLSDAGQTIEQRIDTMYLAAFARKASDVEKQEAIAFLDSQSLRFGTPESQRRSSPQAWADLCHVLFNVKEFVFVE